MTLAGGPVAMAADDEILVAVAGPMTGQYAAFGRAMKFGAEQAVAKINADGGIAGRKIRLLIEDDVCDKAKAVSVAQRLVTEKIDLVIGHHCASASIAAAPVYAAAGIIMISPGTTDPQFTDKRAGPTVFRLAPRDDSEGPAIGTYMVRSFAGKRVAILHDRTVATIAVAAAAKKAMNTLGLSEVLYSGFIAGEPDYSRLAKDVIANRVEAVLLAAHPTEAALIVAALRAQDAQAIIVGTSLLSADEFATSARPFLNSKMVVLDDTAVFGPSRVDNLADAHHEASVQSLLEGKIFARTYSALQAWTQAAISNPIAPHQAMHTTNFKTMAGEFSFDKKGDAKLPFFMMLTWTDRGNMVRAP